MVVRNSELSFHVRRLEERVGSLEKIRKDLVSLQFASQHHGPHFTLSSSFLLLLSSSQQEKLETAESQRRPLKEHNVKLSQRINDLNSALRSQEKRVKQLAQENLVLVCAVQTLYTHLVLACTIFCFTIFPSLPSIFLSFQKSAKQQLEEEHARQRKSLNQQLSKGSLYRTEKEKLVNQNRELAETTTVRVRPWLLWHAETYVCVVTFIPPLSPLPSLLSLLSPSTLHTLHNIQNLYAKVEELEQKNVNLQKRLSSSLPASLTSSPIPPLLQSGKCLFPPSLPPSLPLSLSLCFGPAL